LRARAIAGCNGCVNARQSIVSIQEQVIVIFSSFRKSYFREMIASI